jgi:hypothetical protein
MHNLPLISHHLFVAAVANKDRVQLNGTSQETPAGKPAYVYGGVRLSPGAADSAAVGSLDPWEAARVFSAAATADRRTAPNSQRAGGQVRSIPLEVMAQGKGSPAEAARPLRAARGI